MKTFVKKRMLRKGAIRALKNNIYKGEGRGQIAKIEKVFHRFSV